jgi:PAP2 superfamily
MTATDLIRRRPRFAREVGLALVAYGIYEAARWLAAGSFPLAHEHALQVMSLERYLHLDAEDAVQRAFLDSPLLPVLNYVYLAAQDVVLPAALVLVYRLNRGTYRTLRNTLLATWALALPVYALFPTAPPRLAGLGIVDTVSTGSPMRLDSGAATVLRAAALLWGPLVLLTVIATGNHFVFDAIAGLAITAAGYALGRIVGSVRRSQTRVVAVCAPSAMRPLEAASPA